VAAGAVAMKGLLVGQGNELSSNFKLDLWNSRQELLSVLQRDFRGDVWLARDKQNTKENYRKQGKGLHAQLLNKPETFHSQRKLLVCAQAISLRYIQKRQVVPV
jgi:hypothetical protein